MFNQDKAGMEGGLTLSPKTSFILGLVGGTMLLCTIGFFILLGIVLNGDSADVKSAKPTPVAGDTVPTAPSAPEGSVPNVTPISSEDHVWGSDDASVELVIYSDLECPYCGNFHSTVKQIQAQYSNDVRIAFRHFPLSFHPNAVPAALASECAAAQGKFWEYIDVIFANQDSLSSDLYESTAEELGLNMTKFKACVTNADGQAKIDADRAGGAAAGISGTPGSVIIGADGSRQEIPGALPFEQVKPMLDRAL